VSCQIVYISPPPMY